MNGSGRSNADAMEAARLVGLYMDRLHGALLLTATEDCADLVEELRSHVEERLLSTDGTSAAVQDVLDTLGTPEELARRCADIAEDDEGGADERPGGLLAGTVFGMPYDLRVPDSGRIAERWWNPLDARVIVPRVFGVGWTVNFAAVAVRLGSIRPDDEDLPFDSVPDRLVWASVAVPCVIATVFVGVVAWRWAGLPATLPAHWDLAGNVDQYWSKHAAIGLPLAISVAGVAGALRVHAGRAPVLRRVAASAMAAFLTTLALTILAQTLHTVDGRSGMPLFFLGLLASFGVPFLMLLGLSVAGRAAERRRDLGKEGAR